MHDEYLCRGKREHVEIIDTKNVCLQRDLTSVDLFFHSNKPDSIPTLPCVQNKVRPRTIYRTDVCNIITSVHQTRNSCFM